MNYKKRDNDYGVTWCIITGRLFNKPCGKRISLEDTQNFNILKNPNKTYLKREELDKLNY